MNSLPKLDVISQEEYQTSKWSGGTTTQLIIYPFVGVSYANRDFIFRISSANVDLLESDFTKLSGYKRYLMILDGKLELEHKNQYKKTLNQFEIEFFDGAWDSHSIGKVIDYNIMFNPGNSKINDIYYFIVKNSEEKTFKLQNPFFRKQFISFYLYQGNCTLTANSCSQQITEKQFAYIIFDETSSQPEIKISFHNTNLTKKCIIVVNDINFND